jgi:hypothetical protein
MTQTSTAIAAAMAALNNLPPDLGRKRIVDAKTSAAFWGLAFHLGGAYIAPARYPARSRSATVNLAGALAISLTD